ncbi:MAG: nuclear transport factor 2 family protein [Streptosporangiales bacterium]|nr:nuclear transport factor 2 family protein [Streptosporangiales bacterium]
MALGDLSVVESWQAAANARDKERLTALSAEDIEIIGPRGTGRGHGLLTAWLDRAGLATTPLRWFCGADGRVVVEQDAQWRSLESGDVLGRQRVGSRFRVRDGRVIQIERCDDLESALSAAGLDRDDEVVERAH